MGPMADEDSIVMAALARFVDRREVVDVVAASAPVLRARPRLDHVVPPGPDLWRGLVAVEVGLGGPGLAAVAVVDVHRRRSWPAGTRRCRARSCRAMPYLAAPASTIFCDMLRTSARVRGRLRRGRGRPCGTSPGCRTGSGSRSPTAWPAAPRRRVVGERAGHEVGGVVRSASMHAWAGTVDCGCRSSAGPSSPPSARDRGGHRSGGRPCTW